jgi:hypothetical protein
MQKMIKIYKKLIDEFCEVSYKCQRPYGIVRETPHATNRRSTGDYKEQLNPKPKPRQFYEDQTPP